MATAFGIELRALLSLCRPPAVSSERLGEEALGPRPIALLLASLAALTCKASRNESSFLSFSFCLDLIPKIPLYPISPTSCVQADPLWSSSPSRPINSNFSAFHFRVSASRSALTFPGAIVRVPAIFNRQSYRYSAHRVSYSSITGLGRHPRILFANLGLSSRSCQTRKTISL